MKGHRQRTQPIELIFACTGNWGRRMLLRGMLLLTAAMYLGATVVHAQNATWLANPGSGDFDTATNWSPAIVPTGTAAFGGSNTTTITFSSDTPTGTLQFNAGAPAYTFNLATTSQTLTINGAGIVNNSSNLPTLNAGGTITFSGQTSIVTAGNANITTGTGGSVQFVTLASAGNLFQGFATAGTATITTNTGGVTEFSGLGTTASNATILTNGGTTEFLSQSTAANATITNSVGGSTNFSDTSTAGTATITNNTSGLTQFSGSSTAGNAIIINNFGGVTRFLDTSTAGDATIIVNSGGIADFSGPSAAGSAVITTNSGGLTEFIGTNTAAGGNARFITNAGGTFDISRLAPGGMTAGSIEGAGTYFLGSKTLTVGLNNLSTVVSGVIADGGLAGGMGAMLIKDGSGTLTLTGLNTYSGGTMISAGSLQIGDGGTTGSIAGNVAVNNNSTLAFDRSDFVTFAGVISGTGSVQDLGGGKLTLTGSNTYFGGTELNNGTLIVAATNALGTGPVSVNDPSLLQINPGVTITNPIAINNGGSLINGGTIQVSAAPGGPIVAITTSAGATISNQSGGMIAGFGLIVIQSASGSATVTNSGVISGTEGIALSNGGIITNNVGGAISGSSGTAIASSGGSTKLLNAGIINGNVTLGSGANTVQLFSGSRIGGSLNLGTNTASNLILAGSGQQLLSQAVTGTMTNAGSLTKQGSGNWVIDVALNAPVSTNVFSGALTVNNSLTSRLLTVQAGALLKGTGSIFGNVVNAGTISPGDAPGAITIVGNFTQGPGGTYNVQIFSPQNYSQLIVTGHASLNGTLHLTLASGFHLVAGEQFIVLKAGQGISGTFSSISSSSPVNVTYSNGVVDVTALSTSRPPVPTVLHLSDGTPDSTTALMADSTFYGFGSLSENMALGILETSEPSRPSTISVTFNAGEFDFEGEHGKTYTIPIAGGFKINDRVRLDYEIPLQYVTIANTSLMLGGATIDLPVKVILPSPDQPWSWTMTPTAAFAASGSREIIGGGALSNLFTYRWHGITASYGNYISFFNGDVLTSNDPRFPAGVSQQIMKNGLRFDIPFHNDWIVDIYGIYTQFFQSAQIPSYATIGVEVGRRFTWSVEGQNVDLGFLSLGLYTEFGNNYQSGHIQIGSAWRF
jgi:autotransporter-associated beta strand protein